MSDYKIIDEASGIIVTQHWQFGTQVWTLSKMTRKYQNDECAICNIVIGKKAYRPITNLSNRMKRICISHGQDLGKSA